MNYEEKTLIAARKKKQITYKEKSIRLTWDFSATLEERRQHNNAIKIFFHSDRLGSKAVSDTYYSDKLLNLFMPQFPYL